MLVTRAGDLALEIAAGLSVCLSVWAVRDVSTPWPTDKGCPEAVADCSCWTLAVQGMAGRVRIKRTPPGDRLGAAALPWGPAQALPASHNGQVIRRWLDTTPWCYVQTGELTGGCLPPVC